jgi:cbb3-type cytochrome oxidase maturation protein
MGVIYFLLPLSILLAALGVWACVSAVRSGQFDDLDSPAMRVLFDDETLEADKTADGKEERVRKKG